MQELSSFKQFQYISSPIIDQRNSSAIQNSSDNTNNYRTHNRPFKCVLNAGADGVAVISDILQDKDPIAKTKAWLEIYARLTSVRV